MTAIRIVGWADIDAMVKELTRDARGREPKTIFAIATGGLFPGKLLADRFDAQLRVLHARSYRGRARGRVSLHWDPWELRTPLTRPVWLVDDLVDSGVTMAETSAFLTNMGVRHRCAVLIRKGGYTGEADDLDLIWATTSDPHSWISFPWDRYETERGGKS